MIKVDKPGIGFFKATVPVDKVLDAVEWCNNHPSQGEFHVNWGITQHTENYVTYDAEIMGTFGFSDRNDHMLFMLKWT